MPSFCNLHLAGRAVAAQNQDRIPQVNGNRGRWLMMPVLVWKRHSRCNREDKSLVTISSEDSAHFPESRFKHKYNTHVCAVMFIEFSHRSVVSCMCERKRKEIWLRVRLPLKRSPESSQRSSHCSILAENSLTISTVAAQDSTLTSLERPSQLLPHSRLTGEN